MAITALVCGIVGALMGMIPILALPALILGVLALVFGGIAWRRAIARHIKKGMAIAGVLLGAASITLAIIGFVIVNNAFS